MEEISAESKIKIKRILFYGDSNTYGYDPRSFVGGRYPENVRWTGVLKRRLAPETSVYADGMNGRPVPASEDAVRSAKWSLLRVGPLDLFAVMLGSNDLLDSREGAEKTVRVTAFHLQNFLERIMDLKMKEDGGSGPAVQQALVIAPPQIGPGSWGSDALEQERKMLSEAYRMAACQNGWSFADSAEWQCELSADGVHLTADGHKCFADHMDKAIHGLF